MSEMIEVRNVSKSFGDKTVIKNVSVVIEDGEYVVLSGPSGCGKTTMLHLIGGIEQPTEGDIYVNGKALSIRRNQRDFLKYEAAFLFQNFALVDKKTVRQNLAMIPEDSRSGIGLAEALKYVGMTGCEDDKVYTLSGGEQQRIALARVLMKRSNIIFADEPTGSLDRKNAELVMRILKQMNDEGKSVVLVTHMDEFQTFATKIVDLGNTGKGSSGKA